MKTINLQFPIVEIIDTKFTWSVDQEQTAFPRFEVQKNSFNPRKDSPTISYTIDAKMVEHTARNIISYVPSKRKTKKTIVFTAHYDHLGRMGQTTYFPGGNDNASGVAMLVELARYYVSHPLKKTNVVFIAFAGEEVGLLGSQYYVEHPIFPLKNIQFLFNTDIMGSGEEGITIVNATLFPQQFKLLNDINTQKKYVSRIGARGAAANSDHYYFSEKGVPAFFMYTQGPNKHYHDVYDTYEELSFNEFNDLFHLLIDFGTELSKSN